MGFKDRLKEKRVEANLTQAALAEKVPVTARTIQNYELGTRKPTKYDIVKKTCRSSEHNAGISSRQRRNARSRSTGTRRSKSGA